MLATVIIIIWLKQYGVIYMWRSHITHTLAHTGRRQTARESRTAKDELANRSYFFSFHVDFCMNWMKDLTNEITQFMSGRYVMYARWAKLMSRLSISAKESISSNIQWQQKSHKNKKLITIVRVWVYCCHKW